MMKKRALSLLLVLTVFWLACCRAAGGREKLETNILELLQGFNGDVGVFVRHLPSKTVVGVNENKIFPTASMVKIPILVKIFDKIEAGALTMDSVMIFNQAAINYPWKGDDALARFKDGEDITISKLLTHMITFSDNHASLWLQDMAGGGAAVNAWLENNGFVHTRVNSRTAGREAEYEKFGWGQTTPREMAELLVMIREGRAVSPTASADMYRHLTRSYWDDEGLSQIPPTVQAASKQGAVSQSRSEVVLVNAPHGDYVFSIITDNQTDKSWTHDNEGFMLIRSLSKLLWQHFEL
jgi:beta-lactamase class A